MDIKTLREWEKELFGLVITESQEEAAKRAALEHEGNGAIVYASNEKLNEEGRRVRVIGKLVSIDHRTTRNGDPFLTAKMSMLDDEIELTVWSNVLERTLGIWHEDVYAEVRGSVRMFNNSAGVAVSSAVAYIPTQNGDSRLGVNGSSNGSANGVNGNGSHVATYHGATGRTNGEAQTNGKTMGSTHDTSSDEPAVTLSFECDGEATPSRETIHEILLALGEHKGDGKVLAKLSIDGKTVSMDFPFFSVEPSQQLRAELASILGESNVEMSVDTAN